MDNIKIKFESPSGATLLKRFNTLVRYYASQSEKNSAEWIATEFKKSLIRTIENGTIVVVKDNEPVGLA